MKSMGIAKVFQRDSNPAKRDMPSHGNKEELGPSPISTTITKTFPACAQPPPAAFSGNDSLHASAKGFELRSKGERACEHKKGGEQRPLARMQEQKMKPV